MEFRLKLFHFALNLYCGASELKCFEHFWNARLKFLSETVNIYNVLFRVLSLYVTSFVLTSILCCHHTGLLPLCSSFCTRQVFCFHWNRFFEHDFHNGEGLECFNSESDTIRWLSICSKNLMETHLER